MRGPRISCRLLPASSGADVEEEAVSLDLARLLEDPSRVTEISDAEILRTMLELAGHVSAVSALQSALASRLVLSSGGAGNGRPEASAADRSLTPQEAATRLGVTLAWLYRHHTRLPFARKLSPKCLRFSEAGLRKWLAAQGTGQPWK
jgi:predicted DNA-binding transcriptional regulator AlpA